MIFEALIAENSLDIERHPERHLIQNGRQHSSNRRCPSQHLWPIECGCHQGSIIQKYNLTPRPGANLVLVPASLISNWHKEWVALGVSHAIPIRFHVAHSDFPCLAFPDAIRNHLHLTYHPNDSSATATDKVLHFAHRYIIVSSTQSYMPHVVRALGINYGPRSGSSGSLAIGRLFRDESHTTRGSDTMIFEILKSILCNGWTPPNFFPLTATPMMRNGLSDMAASITAINMVSPGIQNDPEARHFADSNVLDDLVQADAVLREARRAGRVVDANYSRQVITKIGQLLVCYCMQRRNDTIQMGKTLAFVPPLEERDVFCPADPSYRQTLEQAAPFLKSTAPMMLDGTKMSREFEVRELLGHMTNPRLFATIPHLTFMRSSYNMTLENMSRQGWLEYPETSPFWDQFDKILQSSGKLQMLQRLFLRLGKDWKGLPEPIVVVSEFVQVCHSVLLVSVS